MSYLLLQGDAVHIPFPDRSVDLVFGSPPYIDARTYGIKAQRACQEWIDWMLVVTEEACRVSKGLVLWVCASGVRNHCYQPAPEGLLYKWWRRGGQCWRPAYWYRSGIPGSGGQYWLRADIEYVLSFLGQDRRPRRGRPDSHRGEPSPDDPNAFWVNNAAMGHTTNFPSRVLGPGGERGKAGESQVFTTPALANPGNLIETDPKDEGVWTDNTAMGSSPKYEPGGNFSYRQRDGGHANDNYQPPILANPGNLIRTNNGYGHLGSPHAHDNEAPFPEDLAEFFVKTACPPGGTVLDPFSGSGTSVAVAERFGRHGIGLDIRRSQAEIAVRRITRPHSRRKRIGREVDDLPLFR